MLAEKVTDQDIGHRVAVGVAKRDSHVGFRQTFTIDRHSQRLSPIFERAVAPVPPEGVALRHRWQRDSRPAVAIAVGRQDPIPRHAATPADLVTSQKCPLPLVAIENIGQAAEFLRQTVSAARSSGCAKGRLRLVEREVIGDKQIEVAILIEIAECSPEAPASTANAGCVSRVCEPPAIAVISPKRVSTVARHVDVGVAVGVVVSHRDPLTIAFWAQLPASEMSSNRPSPRFLSNTSDVGRVPFSGLRDPPWAKKRSSLPSPSKSSRPTPPPVVSTGQAEPVSPRSYWNASSCSRNARGRASTTVFGVGRDPVSTASARCERDAHRCRNGRTNELLGLGFRLRHAH